MRRGDLIRFCQASGGGYGDPMTRDPEQVRLDVRDDLVSIAMAQTMYGVVIDADSGALCGKETEQLRGASRSATSDPGTIEVVQATEADVQFMTEAANHVREGNFSKAVL